jgi:hypothetical protein
MERYGHTTTTIRFGVQARTPICAWRVRGGLACIYQPPGFHGFKFIFSSETMISQMPA